jgi:hypothetical protein
MSSNFRHRPAGIVRIAALLVLGIPLQAGAASAWDGMAPSPVWGDVQYGLEMLQPDGAAQEDIKKNSSFWKVEAGGRLNREWLVGAGTQAISLESFNKITQLYGTVIYNPGRGPWLYQAALGQATYKVNFSGRDFDEKYTGPGAQLGVGYDWTPDTVNDVHLGMRLTFEYSWLGQRDGGLGSLNHSRVGLGLSISFY